MTPDLTAIILETLDTVITDQQRSSLSLSASTTLFGADGILDSTGIVTLVIALEQELETRLGVTISLADEKALSQRNSPFRTVSTLAEYIQQQMLQGA